MKSSMGSNQKETENNYKRRKMAEEKKTVQKEVPRWLRQSRHKETQTVCKEQPQKDQSQVPILKKSEQVAKKKLQL